MDRNIKYISSNFNKCELELINVLMYACMKSPAWDSRDLSCGTFALDANMHEIMASMNIYPLKLDTFLDYMESLRTKKMVITFVNSRGFLTSETISVITKYAVTRKDDDVFKRFQIFLDNTFVTTFVDRIDLIENMLKLDKFGINGKFSKNFYNTFAHKIDVEITLSLKEFLHTIDFQDINETTTFSIISTNVIKRIIQDMQKSDISVNLTVTKPKGEHHFLDRVVSVSVSQKESTNVLVDDIEIIKRKTSYQIYLEVDRRVKKMNNLSHIQDLEKYKHKIFHNIKKEEYEEYESRAKLMSSLNTIKFDAYEDMVGMVILKNCNKIAQAAMDNDFKLRDLETNKILTKTAIATLIEFDKFIKSEGEFDILETSEYLKNFSVSYTYG